MFFLSASANIIIYALISAFCVVCLQLKSESKISDFFLTTGIVILHEPEETEVAYDYMAYHQEQLLEEQPKCEYGDIVDLCFYTPPFVYDNPNLTHSSLRAPPSLKA